MRNSLFLALLLATPAAFAASYGAPMPEGEAVSIAVAAAEPAVHAGTPAKFAGRITQVCQKEGCWVVLERDGEIARVTVKDHAFAVPRDASGEAIAYGVLESRVVTDEQKRHLVEDDGAAAPADQELRIVATGIEILD